MTSALDGGPVRIRKLHTVLQTPALGFIMGDMAGRNGNESKNTVVMCLATPGNTSPRNVGVIIHKSQK